MNTYGLAWSLLLAGFAAVGSVFVLVPVSPPRARLADRVVLGGLMGVLVGRSVAVVGSDATVRSPLRGFGGDLEF